MPSTTDTTLHHLKISGNILFDFADSLQEAVDIKDSQSGKYLYTNQQNLNLHALEQSEEMIGKTATGLGDLSNDPNHVSLVNKIISIDQEVITHKKVCRDNKITFANRLGTIQVIELVKTPVLNEQEEVSAIMTISHDLTKKMNHFERLELYKNHYTKKSIAVSHFMKHLKIEPFFQETLTEKEMICLLHLSHKKTYKQIAAQTFTSIKTIETHISNTISKLNKTTLQAVIQFLQ